ncbi:MAG: zinc-ribbon domain-containing protein [Deltaproteobacteria bacterium]|nr:zinc-ribbon domain-containing protein [Deltaproteobacteria bacterium]
MLFANLTDTKPGPTTCNDNVELARQASEILTGNEANAVVASIEMPPRTWVKLGDRLYNCRETDPAVYRKGATEAYRVAADLDPQSWRALGALAVIASQDGLREEACKRFQAALASCTPETACGSKSHKEFEDRVAECPAEAEKKTEANQNAATPPVPVETPKTLSTGVLAGIMGVLGLAGLALAVLKLRRRPGVGSPSPGVLGDERDPRSSSILTKCPDCGHDVSRRATACPHCGAPLEGSISGVPAAVPEGSRVAPPDPIAFDESDEAKSNTVRAETTDMTPVPVARAAEPATPRSTSVPKPVGLPSVSEPSAKAGVFASLIGEAVRLDSQRPSAAISSGLDDGTSESTLAATTIVRLREGEKPPSPIGVASDQTSLAGLSEPIPVPVASVVPTPKPPPLPSQGPTVLSPPSTQVKAETVPTRTETPPVLASPSQNPLEALWDNGTKSVPPTREAPVSSERLDHGHDSASRPALAERNGRDYALVQVVAKSILRRCQPHRLDHLKRAEGVPIATTLRACRTPPKSARTRTGSLAAATTSRSSSRGVEEFERATLWGRTDRLRIDLSCPPCPRSPPAPRRLARATLRMWRTRVSIASSTLWSPGTNLLVGDLSFRASAGAKMSSRSIAPLSFALVPAGVSGEPKISSRTDGSRRTLSTLIANFRDSRRSFAPTFPQGHRPDPSRRRTSTAPRCPASRLASARDVLRCSERVAGHRSAGHRLPHRWWTH